MNVSNEGWWNGIILTPSKERPGLLPQIVLDGAYNFYFFLLIAVRTALKLSLWLISENRGRCYPKVCVQSSTSFDSSSETESSDNYKSNKLLKQFSTTTSSDGCESDFSSPRPVKPHVRPPQRYLFNFFIFMRMQILQISFLTAVSQSPAVDIGLVKCQREATKIINGSSRNVQ